MTDRNEQYRKQKQHQEMLMSKYTKGRKFSRTRRDELIRKSWAVAKRKYPVETN